MKSSFSHGTSNCVDVTKTRNGTVRVRDTKHKTGDVELEFTRAEWLAFVLGVAQREFDYIRLPFDTTDDRPMTNRERTAALTRAGQDGLTRTPENLAYVNGQHAERAGWVPYTLGMFCRKFNHDVKDAKTKALYDAFMTGRRAEAHEISMRQAREESGISVTYEAQ